VTDLLNKYLSAFLEGLDKSQLNMGLGAHAPFVATGLDS
jgi:hypothetical protein